MRAVRDDFNDYGLGNLPLVPGQTALPVHFFPDDLPLDRVNDFKAEFAIWITACGLREMMEHYATFLDKMHNFALLVRHSLNRLGDTDPVRAHATFVKRGVPDKLKKLRTTFGITITYERAVESLYEARNCLTHNHGIVVPDRCTDDHLRVSWLAPTARMRGTETGIEVPQEPLIGVTTGEEMIVEFLHAERVMNLAPGEPLRLSHQDLREILYFFGTLVIPATASAFSSLLTREGIPMRAGGG